MKHIFSGIRTRLILLVLLALIPSIALILYNSIEERSKDRLNAQNNARHVIEKLSLSQKAAFQRTEHILISIAETYKQFSHTNEVCHQYLGALINKYQDYNQFTMFTPQGELFCSGPKAIKKFNISDRYHYKIAVQTKKTANSGYLISRLLGKPSLFIAHPILNDANKIIALINAGLDLRWMNDVLRQETLPKQGQLTIFDENGVVLSQHPAKKGMPGSNYKHFSQLKPSLEKEHVSLSQASIKNTNYLYAFDTLHQGATKTYVAISLPIEIIEANANTQLTRNLILLAIVTLLAVAAAWFVGNVFISKNIISLVNATRRLEAGDLSARTHLPKGHSELHEMASSFNNMADALQEREIELRESRERFLLAMKGSNDGLWDWNLITNEIYFSPRWKSMLGYKNDELENKVSEWEKLVHKDDLADAKNAIELSISGEIDKYNTEFRMKHKNGHYVDILSRGFLVTEDKPIRLVGTHVDITEQKKMLNDVIQAKQQAEEANKAKSKFLSNMSHELRTPLNAILGFSQLLELNEDDDTKKKNIKDIIDGGNHLLELINEILDLAKIESGHVDLSIKEYSLNKIINNSLLMIKPLAEKQAIQIDDKVSSLPNINISIDERRFKQVLLNLLSNAIKYNSEKGKVTIDSSPCDENMFCLSITDTGKGFTIKQLSHLFEPFERFGAEYSHIEGTGLGLVIAKDLIELMGGTITAKSEVGKGSCFMIYVPLA